MHLRQKLFWIKKVRLKLTFHMFNGLMHWSTHMMSMCLYLTPTCFRGISVLGTRIFGYVTLWILSYCRLWLNDCWFVWWRLLLYRYAETCCLEVMQFASNITEDTLTVVMRMFCAKLGTVHVETTTESLAESPKYFHQFNSHFSVLNYKHGNWGTETWCYRNLETIVS